MKKNPILFKPRWRYLWSRYQKLKTRLEKAMKSGTFYRYTRKKRQQLIARLQRYARQLASKKGDLNTLTKGSLASLLLAGTMTAVPTNKAEAQSFVNGFPDGNFGGISSATPRMVDIDGDGDLDMFVGNNSGNIIFLENIGSSDNPIFGTSQTNPFGLEDIGSKAAPEFVDINGDGDLDVFIGDASGNITYFENVGDSSAPAFDNSSMNPFGLTSVTGNAIPRFIDINGDDDLDAFIGGLDGKVVFYENTGDSNSAQFSGAAANPFGLVDVGANAALSFVDINGDDDLDVFIGNGNGVINFFENTGDSNSAQFGSSTPNPFGLFDIGSNAVPDFVDIDGDGNLDAFVGERFSSVRFLGNIPDASGNPSFTEFHNFRGIPNLINNNAFVNLADIDGDGDLDIIHLDYSNNMQFLENTGDSNVPVFAPVNAAAFGFPGNGRVSFDLVDIDGDGDLDVFNADFSNNIQFFENTGNSNTPGFNSGVPNPFGITQAECAAPIFVDIDGDGDLDAFIVERDCGNMNFFENTGASNNPAFDNVSINPFGLTQEIKSQKKPNFVDIDGDCDLDFLTSDYCGNVIFVENTGTSESPAFGNSSQNPFGLSAFNNMTFEDIDGDGDLDGILVNSTGHVQFFENQVIEVNSPPEIGLTGNGMAIADNASDTSPDNNTDFGNTEPGNTITKTFTIQNTGAGGLNLGENAISINGTDKDNFSLITKPNSIVGAGENTTFTIGFTPSNFGEKTAEISINNSDADENPFNFAIKGLGSAKTDRVVSDPFISNPAAANVMITVSNAENGVTYELKTLAGASLSPAVMATGDGSDLVLPILQANAPTSNTTFKVEATIGGVTVDLIDQAVVTVISINDADADATNEIQTLDVSELDGTTLKLSLSSDGEATKEISLSSLQDGTGTDDQKVDKFELAGTTLSLSVESDGENDKTVDLSSLQDGTGTDDQKVDKFELSGTTLSLSVESDGEDDKTVDLSSLQDGTGTDDQKVDKFELAGTTLSLSVESDGENDKTVDLSSLQDGTGTDDQTATEVANTPAGNIAATDVQAAINELDSEKLSAEVDGSTTNELQTLDVASLSGTTLNLSLSNDGEATKTVDLSSLQDGTGTDDQTATEVANTPAGNIAATDVQAAINELDSEKLSAEVDGSTTNELQTLDVASLSGTTLNLSLSNDGEATKTVDLSSLQDGTGTDDQTATEVANTPAGNIAATDVQAAINELDSEKLSAEVDGSTTNELQTLDVASLSGTTLNLSLSNDGEATKTVDLSSLQDGTGTDDQTLAEVLGQGTDANANTITNLLAINSTNGAKLTPSGIWMNASDRSRKTNIEALNYGLAELLKLRPVEYDYKADGSHSIGFIAQELEKILPELVQGKEGNKALAYDLLTAVLVKALQETHQKNEEQEKEIDALQAENARLQTVEKRIAKLENLVSQLIDTNSSSATASEKDK